jgi:hypothetical protein
VAFTRAILTAEHLDYSAPMRLRLLACVAVSLAAGCGPTIDRNSPCTTTPSFAALNSGTIALSCAKFDVCHSAAGKMDGLDLQTNPYTALVNAPTTCTVDPCVDGAKDFPTRVIPGDPVHSFLWVKLTLSQMIDPKYGNRMPQSNPSLDEQTLHDFRCWIAGGAPNN